MKLSECALDGDMQSAIELLNELSQSWISLTFAVVLQSTLIGLGIAAIANWVPKSAPSVRCWLWKIVAAKLLLMPFWVFAVPLPALYEVGKSQATLPTDPRNAEDTRPPNSLGDGPVAVEPGVSADLPLISPQGPRLSWQAWLVLIWFVVVVAQIGRILYQRVRLHRLLREATAASDQLFALTEQLASQIGLKYSPKTLVTEAAVSPFVCGVFRPRVVLPQDLQSTLSDEQLGQVILHELSHIKRGDLIWGWVPEVARILYFFHPLAHWMSYQIRLERELTCDQAAIAASGQAAPDYADTLVKVARQSSPPQGPRLGVAG